MTPTATAAPTLHNLLFGSMEVKAARGAVSPAPRSIQRVGTGSNVERGSRPGQTPLVYNDLSGGMRQLVGVGSWNADITSIYANNGVQTRKVAGKGGLGILPEKVTNQASMTSEQDVSGFTTLNKLGHGVVASWGDTGARLLIGLGGNIFGDTSLTDQTLKVRAAGAGNDYVIAGANLRFAGVDYAAFSWKNVLDYSGIYAYADVSGSGAPAGTQLVTPTALGDGFYVMQYLPAYHSNILGGVYGGVSGWWYVKDDAAIPAIPQPLVFEVNKDVFSSTLPTTTTTAKPATYVVSQAYFTNETNILLSDNNYVSHAAIGASLSTADLSTYGYDFTEIPSTAQILGITASVEAHESNADDNCTLVITWIAGSFTGSGTTAEIATTDTVYTIGDLNNRYLTNGLLGSTVRDGMFGQVHVASLAGAVTCQAFLDYISITIRWRATGLQLPFAAGANGSAASPTDPNTIAYLEPVSAEPTARTLCRRLTLNAITWDATGERPVGAMTYPNTGLRDVLAVTPFLGAYLCIGSEKPGAARMAKLCDPSSGQTRNLNFPGFHGTTEIRLNNVWSQGEWAIFEVCNADFSDMQLWYWYSSAFYADTLQQSLAGQSIALRPIVMAENYISPHQSVIYDLYPRTTHTAVRSMFLSPDLGQDPRATNVTKLKTMATVSSAEDTKVYVIGVEVDFGPEEANKNVGQFGYLGRSISASSTVTFGFNITGSGSVSAPSASNTFTAAHSTYDIPLAGIDFTTFQPWWGLAHTTGTANTPNCLTTLIYSAQQFESKELYVFECDPRTLKSPSSNAQNDFWGAMDDINTMVNAALVVSLQYSNINGNAKVPVVLEDWNFGRASILTADVGAPQKPGDFDDVRLMMTFRRVLGKATA